MRIVRVYTFLTSTMSVAGSSGVFEKLMVAMLLKQITVFVWKKNWVITVFTIIPHLSLSKVSRTQPITSHTVYPRYTALCLRLGTSH